MPETTARDRFPIFKSLPLFESEQLIAASCYGLVKRFTLCRESADVSGTGCPLEASSPAEAHAKWMNIAKNIRTV